MLTRLAIGCLFRAAGRSRVAAVFLLARKDAAPVRGAARENEGEAATNEDELRSHDGVWFHSDSPSAHAGNRLC